MSKKIEMNELGNVTGGLNILPNQIIFSNEIHEQEMLGLAGQDCYRVLHVAAGMTSWVKIHITDVKREKIANLNKVALVVRGIIIDGADTNGGQNQQWLFSEFNWYKFKKTSSFNI